MQKEHAIRTAAVVRFEKAGEDMGRKRITICMSMYHGQRRRIYRAQCWCCSILAHLVVRFLAAPTAADTGVADRVGAAGPRLWAICARTRCPAASAEHRLSSPARTAAATIRASRRAFSPGSVGWEPRTPSRSSIADCPSRMVPPPMVPTSMDGIETAICRLPLMLEHQSAYFTH